MGLLVYPNEGPDDVNEESGLGALLLRLLVFKVKLYTIMISKMNLLEGWLLLIDGIICTRPCSTCASLIIQLTE